MATMLTSAWAEYSRRIGYGAELILGGVDVLDSLQEQSERGTPHKVAACGLHRRRLGRGQALAELLLAGYWWGDDEKAGCLVIDYLQGDLEDLGDDEKVLDAHLPYIIAYAKQCLLDIGMRDVSMQEQLVDWLNKPGQSRKDALGEQALIVCDVLQAYTCEAAVLVLNLPSLDDIVLFRGVAEKAVAHGKTVIIITEEAPVVASAQQPIMRGFSYYQVDRGRQLVEWRPGEVPVYTNGARAAQERSVLLQVEGTFINISTTERPELVNYFTLLRRGMIDQAHNLLGRFEGQERFVGAMPAELYWALVNGCRNMVIAREQAAVTQAHTIFEPLEIARSKIKSTEKRREDNKLGLLDEYSYQLLADLSLTTAYRLLLRLEQGEFTIMESLETILAFIGKAVAYFIEYTLKSEHTTWRLSEQEQQQIPPGHEVRKVNSEDIIVRVREIGSRIAARHPDDVEEYYRDMIPPLRTTKTLGVTMLQNALHQVVGQLQSLSNG
jgi:hypothetical protein